MNEEQVRRLVQVLEDLEAANRDGVAKRAAKGEHDPYAKGRADAYEYALELVRRAQAGKL